MVVVHNCIVPQGTRERRHLVHRVFTMPVTFPYFSSATERFPPSWRKRRHPKLYLQIGNLKEKIIYHCTTSRFFLRDGFLRSMVLEGVVDAVRYVVHDAKNKREKEREREGGGNFPLYFLRNKYYLENKSISNKGSRRNRNSSNVHKGIMRVTQTNDSYYRNQPLLSTSLYSNHSELHYVKR